MKSRGKKQMALEGTPDCFNARDMVHSKGHQYTFMGYESFHVIQSGVYLRAT